MGAVQKEAESVSMVACRDVEFSSFRECAVKDCVERRTRALSCRLQWIVKDLSKIDVLADAEE